MGSEFFWETKKGVLAYVIARPLTTAVSVIAMVAGVYGESELRFDRVYIYTTFINSTAQTWALYCLVSVGGEWTPTLAKLVIQPGFVLMIALALDNLTCMTCPSC